MKKYAVINDQNKVVNLIIWDGVSKYEKPAQCNLIEILYGTIVGIDYEFDGKEFIAPVIII